MGNALNDFVVAAGSYFGLPEGRVMQGSTVETRDGDMELVLRIVLSTDDMVGIGNRMRQLMKEAEADQRAAAARHIAEAAATPTRDELRAMYSQLPAHQRSAFGSFAKYVAAYERAEVRADVAGHGGGVVLPGHVYVPGSVLTAQQLSMAMGMDADGKYAMDPADLTPEQQAEYLPGTEQ